MPLPISIEEKEKLMHASLPFGKSFDAAERKLVIGEKKARLYFLDGFVNGQILDKVIGNFIHITKEEMDKIISTDDFMQRYISGTEAILEDNIENIQTFFLSGFTVIMLDGFSGAIIMDMRNYPARQTQEPEKEKVMRGARDGFVETMIANCALIRRRIRDPKFVYELMNVGNRSRSDVTVAYIDDMVDKKILKTIKEKIKRINTEALTMSLESITECLIRQKWYNPFPKVRMTERPDVAASAILEGNIVIMVDTSPSVLILPTSIFEFMQEPGDFYFPPLVGTYLRLIRNLTFFSTLVITPIWLLALEYMDILPQSLHFLQVREEVFVPIIIQLLILEGAVDVLRLASVNTPSMLGNSLSIIGALLLGDFAVKAGWLNADTILYMSFISIASFAQPSIEFNYSLKFMRIILLLLTYFFNIWGFIGGLLLVVLLIATNKTVTGTGYLYPLIPFNWKALKKFIIRPKIEMK
ncbi:MAG: spore germination protein [Clostridia bacterium]|nr:spore germination protein [Clostridia bacterium]